MPARKKSEGTVSVKEQAINLLDAVIEKTDELITKIITVNRDRLLRNSNKVDIYGKDRATKRGYLGAPIEIQVFRVGKETIMIAAMSMKIDGQCMVQYDPGKFVAPEHCGSVIEAPKAVWIETTGHVTYTDKNGAEHAI